ncbi:MAG: hypothetical protein HQL09_01125 [Nitrospirae bacterium]|nr:hypothetical protein [Nitrospirota bacterium]
MIEYKVVHHVPGRIRLHVPIIRKLSVSTLRKLSTLPVPEGVKDISANPITGSLVITYDPQHVDIMKYVKAMVTNEEVLTTIGTG